MTEPKHSLTEDILFHIFFKKNQDLLKHLVATVLEIRLSSIDEFIIINSEIPPDFVKEKLCRLDIVMKVNSQFVTIEVQVENQGNFPERSLFYWARTFSSSLDSGQPYSAIPKVACINILNFDLFKCPEHKSTFMIMETTRHAPLTDRLKLFYFELPKLPQTVSPDDSLNLWLSFFHADSSAQRERIGALGGTIMKQANDAFNSVISSIEFQALERAREDAIRNEAERTQKIKESEMAIWAEKLAKTKEEFTLELAKKNEELTKKDKELARLRGVSENN